MTTLDGTSANDDFLATSGADTFRFGENEGVDLIVGFDPDADTLSYTDRSVDGFNDLEVARVTINGRISTLVESNDQITVLYEVSPFDLEPRSFRFETGFDGSSFVDLITDLDDLPSDFSLLPVERRVNDLLGVDEPNGIRIAPDRFVNPFVFVDGQGDTELGLAFTDGAGTALGTVIGYEDSELNLDPQAVALADEGRFAVVWRNVDDDDASDARVLVRVFDLDGNRVLFGTLTQLADPDGRVDAPALAVLPGGGFVVAAENDADGTVVAVPYDAVGAAAGPAVVAGAGSEPSVAPSDGGYTITFTAPGGGTATGSFAVDGTPLGATGAPTETEPEPETPNPEPEPQPEPPTPEPDPEPPAPESEPDASVVLTGTKRSDTLTGGSGDDVLRGRNGNDDLDGGAGNDRLFGGGGRDELFGGVGNDLLNGGGKADVLAGGAGTDTLKGGRGADVFVFRPGDGVDEIVDFEVGRDRLDVEGFSGFAAVQQGNDTFVSFGDGDALIVRNTTPADIDDFL